MHFLKVSMIVILGLSTLSCQNRVDDLSLHDLNPLETTSIIGGISAAANEFPFMVNVWLNSPKDHYVAPLCGASLIHKKWVLTAAHCVLEEASETTQRPVKPNTLNLFIGSNHISGREGRALRVNSIVVHPDFSWPHHDVALLELTEPVTDIKPVLLNTEDLGDSQVPITATVIGWGLTDAAGKIDGEWLQKINLPLITRKECAEDMFTKTRGWTIGMDILCANSSQNLKASCSGDSGGPLLRKTTDTYIQIGVVSWGSACIDTPKKMHSTVEGHANVSSSYPWIQSIINSR